jgi:hypothetical protein
MGEVGHGGRCSVFLEGMTRLDDCVTTSGSWVLVVELRFSGGLTAFRGGASCVVGDRW